ncbi:hypothetical protein [Streptomyces sp. NPDC086010]|uniref:hypothetical protein n=1 Tax=Streptomyces sp. NPDC086010 TaxID=3365745 RepID=UPI0037D2A81D
MSKSLIELAATDATALEFIGHLPRALIDGKSQGVGGWIGGGVCRSLSSGWSGSVKIFSAW